MSATSSTFRTSLRRNNARSSPYRRSIHAPRDRERSSSLEPRQLSMGESAVMDRLDDSASAPSAGLAPPDSAVTTATEEVPTSAPTTAATTAALDDIYQLFVRPIVKASINQRDTSAETLSTAVFSGNSFDVINKALWAQYSSHVRKQAMKTNGQWTAERVAFAEWPNLLQFKAKKRVVDSSKSESAWNLWLVGLSGTTVTLMIYEYGMAIATAKDREDFMKKCILPEEPDRAGATAQSTLREVVLALQQNWGTTFQARAVVWLMWANHITRNLNRSTLQDDIASPPNTCCESPGTS